MRFRLTKEFSFEMAHALLGYDGPCKNIHGHSYKLFVTIVGEPDDDLRSCKYGMVMDFTDLKKIVNDFIITEFDHALVINENMSFDNSLLHTKLIEVPYQPTCENLLADFACRIKKQLPESVMLFSLKMYETATSFAEWFKDDNTEL